MAGAATAAELTRERALEETYEWLQLVAAARKRDRAEMILKLAQAISAGTPGIDPNGWDEKQNQLVDEMKTGL